MKSTTEQKAEKFWDRTAASYEKEEARDRGKLDFIIHKTKSYLHEDYKVLDYACATGVIAHAIAPSVTQVDAIDISSRMIALAEESKASMPNINFRQANIFSQELKANTYDAVLAFYILHLLDKPEDVLSRIAQLLKPGGVLITATPCLAEKPILAHTFSLLGGVGLLPKINAFHLNYLVNLFQTEHFQKLDQQKVVGSSTEYFMVNRLR